MADGIIWRSYLSQQLVRFLQGEDSPKLKPLSAMQLSHLS